MKQRWWCSLLMFLWLASGYGTIHVLFLAWIVSISQAFLRSQSAYDSIRMTPDLKPLIVTWDPASNRSVIREPDGALVESEPGLGPNFLGGTTIRSRSQHEVSDWAFRICPMNDFNEPATYWYFVAPPGDHGLGYFMAFDERSRRCLGYIDQRGFTPERPSPEFSFPVKINSLSRQGLAGAIVRAQLAHQYDVALQEPNWTNWVTIIRLSNAEVDSVWVLSHDTIYEIHLRARTVRRLIENRPDMLSLYYRTFFKEGKWGIQLLVRTVNGVSLIDPKTRVEEKVSFGNGDDVDSEELYVQRRVDDEEMKVHRYVIVSQKPAVFPDQASIATVQWMNREGILERQEQIKLQFHQRDIFSNVDLGMSIGLPVPGIYLGVIGLGPVVAPWEFGRSPTYFGCVLRYVSYFSVYLFASLLVGLSTGWACRRREHDVFGCSSWFWPVVVGLCGWFGWVGYLVLRPLPARMPNGAWMKARPEPTALIGTEIFA